jgi:hypothetical protein
VAAAAVEAGAQLGELAAPIGTGLVTGGVTAYGVVQALKVHIQYLREGIERLHVDSKEQWRRIGALESQIVHLRSETHGSNEGQNGQRPF